MKENNLFCELALLINEELYKNNEIDELTKNMIEKKVIRKKNNGSISS